MEQSEFNEKLKEFTKSKIGMKILLPSLELKQKYEKVLYMFYVDELSLTEIADKLKVTREVAGNLICKARKEMFEVITRQYGLLPIKQQQIIKILLSLS